MDPVYNPQLPSSSSSLSSSESCSSWSSLAAGLCAGAVAGAALALVFAPMRGSDMRRSVKGYASQGGERLSQLMESGRCLAGDAISRASELIDEGRRAFRTSSRSASLSSASSSPQPLTASVAEISGMDSRFEEPLGG
jgi:gas vesicle protein